MECSTVCWSVTRAAKCCLPSRLMLGHPGGTFTRSNHPPAWKSVYEDNHLRAIQALAADPREEGLQEVVRHVFGFPGFRGHQLPVVQAVLQGRSTLAIMPTGANKGGECAPTYVAIVLKELFATGHECPVSAVEQEICPC